MFGIVKIGKKLIEKLSKPAYRRSYVAEHVRRGIAYQIRALRDQRDLNQGQLAKLLDKPQSVVSRLEDPSYGKYTIQTLLEVAAVYDVALQVRFVPFSTFLLQSRDVSNEAMKVLSFSDEAAEGRRVFIEPLNSIEIQEVNYVNEGAPADIVSKKISAFAYVQ